MTKSKSPDYPEKKIMTKQKFFDNYLCLNTWKTTPVTEAWLEALAKDLYTWAKDDSNALKMSQFYTSRGISNSTVLKWMKVSEKLREAHDMALQIIGDRREVGAIYNKLNASMIAPMMAHYDSNWKDIAEWRARLRGEAEAKSGKTIIVVPSLEEAERPTPEEVALQARMGSRGATRKKKAKED